jgi:formylmethanofuran dehydrogenase subunit E
MAGEATEAERKQFRQIHFERSHHVLETPAEELFTITIVDMDPPPKARIEPSRPCALCGEPTMPSKMETSGGQKIRRGCF